MELQQQKKYDIMQFEDVRPTPPKRRRKKTPERQVVELVQDTTPVVAPVEIYRDTLRYKYRKPKVN